MSLQMDGTRSVYEVGTTSTRSCHRSHDLVFCADTPHTNWGTTSQLLYKPITALKTNTEKHDTTPRPLEYIMFCSNIIVNVSIMHRWRIYVVGLAFLRLKDDPLASTDSQAMTKQGQKFEVKQNCWVKEYFRGR